MGFHAGEVLVRMNALADLQLQLNDNALILTAFCSNCELSSNFCQTVKVCLRAKCCQIILKFILFSKFLFIIIQKLKVHYWLANPENFLHKLSICCSQVFEEFFLPLVLFLQTYKIE